MANNISFFVVRPNHAPPDGHLQRVSSIIRGYQVAEFLGAKINPREGFENDVCIYVKPRSVAEDQYKFSGKPYLDICDAYYLYDICRKFPHLTVISASDWNYQMLKKVLPNKVVNIYEHHCNFERARRVRQGIKTVGCIGGAGVFKYLPSDLKSKLAEKGIELVTFSNFQTRQDIVNFYLGVDVQIIWRPFADYKQEGVLMNPLKLVNASAFGVPTIALDEPTFKQLDGCYLPVVNLDEFMERLDSLIKSPSLYNEYSERCLAESEKYHIENIAKLYRQLT